jgi:hypothetical protein
MNMPTKPVENSIYHTYSDKGLREELSLLREQEKDDTLSEVAKQTRRDIFQIIGYRMLMAKIINATNFNLEII